MNTQHFIVGRLPLVCKPSKTQVACDRCRKKNAKKNFMRFLAFLHPSRTIACNLRLRGLAHEGEPSNNKMLRIHPLFLVRVFLATLTDFFSSVETPLASPPKSCSTTQRRSKGEQK